MAVWTEVRGSYCVGAIEKDNTVPGICRWRVFALSDLTVSPLKGAVTLVGLSWYLCVLGYSGFHNCCGILYCTV